MKHLVPDKGDSCCRAILKEDEGAWQRSELTIFFSAKNMSQERCRQGRTCFGGQIQPAPASSSAFGCATPSDTVLDCAKLGFNNRFGMDQYSVFSASRRSIAAWYATDEFHTNESILHTPLFDASGVQTTASNPSRIVETLGLGLVSTSAMARTGADYYLKLLYVFGLTRRITDPTKLHTVAYRLRQTIRAKRIRAPRHSASPGLQFGLALHYSGVMIPFGAVQSLGVGLQQSIRYLDAAHCHSIVCALG